MGHGLDKKMPFFLKPYDYISTYQKRVRELMEIETSLEEDTIKDQ